MISPRIARELREAGYDVHAIKRDRPELEGCTDRELIARMSSERRALVTNNVIDFQVIHDRMLVAGDEHAGMVFTFDATLPRSKVDIPQWVEALADLLDAHNELDALRNRVHHLSRPE